MKSKTIASIFCTLLIPIFLAGCMAGGMSFSPQDAAVRAVTEHGDPMMMVDQGSVQVRQSVSIDNKVFVVISYTQRDANRQDKCISIHEAERGSIGTWILRGGGSGCVGTTPGEQEPLPNPIEIGGGSGGGSGPNDPGYSYTYGLVNPTETGATIAKVRVTWNDGQQQEVAVVNGSYLAIRTGELNFEKHEGLDSNGDVVYPPDPQADPGKQ